MTEAEKLAARIETLRAGLRTRGFTEEELDTRASLVDNLVDRWAPAPAEPKGRYIPRRPI